MTGALARLADCAHCGEHDGVVCVRLDPSYPHFVPLWLVNCSRCGMQTSRFNSEAEAIAAWNRRTASAQHAIGWAAAISAALDAQPSTAEDPNEDAYQCGRFDGIMDYGKAILDLPTPSAESVIEAAAERLYLHERLVSQSITFAELVEFAKDVWRAKARAILGVEPERE